MPDTSEGVPVGLHYTGTRDEELWLIGIAATVGTGWLRTTSSARTVEGLFTRWHTCQHQKQMCPCLHPNKPGVLPHPSKMQKRHPRDVGVTEGSSVGSMNEVSSQSY